MLNYCRSTQLQQLADQLLKNFRVNSPSNPLTPEVFVVQNYGIAQWLSIYLAEKEGIAANLSFEFPAERIWKLIRIMEPAIPHQLPSDREPMKWTLMEILKETEDSDLQKLNSYFRASVGKGEEIRRWMLAGQIADVFDEYLTYRPHMLIDWENGNLQTTHSSEKWQASLWNKLVQYWKNHHSANHEHRAQLQNKVLKALDDGLLGPEQLPERISVFGVTTMPPIYLKILVKLSEVTDLTFYCLQYEVECQNDLADSLNRSGRQHMDLLLSAAEDHAAESQNIPLPSPDKNGSDTLFAHFKADIMGWDRVESKPAGDKTIQFHCCHSRRREVEVVYDQLLSMLDEDEELEPSDILVLTPDFEGYAPDIQAVFGNTEEGLPHIPFHLAERLRGKFNLVALSLSNLLSLAESRFKVSEVLDFMDLKPIRDQFGFTEEDINKLERWTADNRIRWGIDGTHKLSLDLPGSNSYTWQSGLNNMMLGVAMKAKDDQLFQGIYPYDEIEQSDDTVLIGKFSMFMNQLFDFHIQLQNPHAVKEWSNLLNKWTSKIIPGTEEYFDGKRKIVELINRLGETADLAQLGERLGFEVIRSNLKNALEMENGGGGRAGAGITFGSLTAMRCIPAKVIWIMGMNDGEFPRSRLKAQFNLISQFPQQGDRNSSRDDRQLIWEALMSAKERFYVSYIGQSNRHDTEYPPSVVVRECMDYVSSRYELESDHLTVKHRLHSHSPDYFIQPGKKELFSYSPINEKVAERLLEPKGEQFSFLKSELPEADSEKRNLSAGELVSFYQHPAKYLLQNRFDIYLRSEEVYDEDREPFQLEGLDKYKLGQELLDRKIEKRDVGPYKQVSYARNILPDGWTGERAFHEYSAEVEEFANHLQYVFEQEKLENREVEVEIDDFKLTAKLQNLYKEGQFLYRFGRMRAKDLIELWIKHLLLQLDPPENCTPVSRLYTRDKKQPAACCELSPVETSKDEIQRLLKIYWKGLTQSIHFFPECSFAYARDWFERGKDENKALRSAKNKWKNEYTDYEMEGEDGYNKILYKDYNPLLDNKFKEITKLFWNPFFEVMNMVGE